MSIVGYPQFFKAGICGIVNAVISNCWLKVVIEKI
jgi:hypothetical protein